MQFVNYNTKERKKYLKIQRKSGSLTKSQFNVITFFFLNCQHLFYFNKSLDHFFLNDKT